MARKRMIDPSFWEDEKLGSVEPIVRLLFMGLISQADDDGRLKGHPSLLRSVIFPYDDNVTNADVDSWLNLLASDERKVIRRYEVDHQKYIVVSNFKKHQTINKPQISKLPEPPSDDSGTTTVVIPEECSSDTAQKKLIEVNLKQEEVNRSEQSAHSLFNDPIKDRIYKFAERCEIKSLSIVVAEMDLFFFIGKLDVEVIEEALKKASGKKFGYANTILTEWINEGKTTMEHHRPKPPQRAFNREFSRSGKPSMPVVSDTNPSPTVTPEEREKMRALARKLKESS